MHTTNAGPAAHLLQVQAQAQVHALVKVNGKRCRLSIEPDGIAWRAEPAESPGGGGGGAKILKAHDNLNDDDDDEATATSTRLKFALIIGTEYGRSKQQQQKKTSNNDKVSSARSDRIKIYYVKQNELKSRNRLLKLKKLIIERAPASRDACKRQRQCELDQSSREDCQLSVDISKLSIKANINRLSPTTAAIKPGSSGGGGGGGSDPPSCYASEGSTGQLSSWSAASSSSSCSQSGCSSPINRSSADQSSCCCCCPSQSLVRISQLIEDRLELERNQASRPRRMLVFVNPFGGKGKAVRLFKTKVRRLLALANIDTRLVITTRANHARDTLEDPAFDVEQFDAIVCVGGDGMFSELMNGLLFRYNRDKLLAAAAAAACKGQPLLSSDHQSSTTAATSSLTGDQQQKGATSSSSGSSGSSGSSSSSSCSTFCDSSIHDNDDDDDDDGDNCEQSSASNGEKTSTSKSLVRLRAALGGIGQPLSRPPVPIGVIGAGSTDANSFGLLGTNDTITAALNIILGKQISIDVCSVHTIRDDRLLRFVSTFVAYGYFGDVVRESERLRWLGPSRYDVTGVNSLLKNRAYRGRVRILLASQRDGSPRDQTAGGRCHTNCGHCLRLSGSAATEPIRDSELEFVERRGSFVGVNAAVTACRCPQTRKGFSPNNHLANGCVDLILVRPCTRIQYVQYLLRTGWTRKSAFDLKYVEAYRCRQFEFLAQHDDHHETTATASTTGGSSVSSSSSSAISSASSSNSAASNSNRSLESATSSKRDSSSSGRSRSSNGGKQRLNRPHSSWNVDGEILDQGSIRVKVNNQLLRVFGTGEPNLALRRSA